MKSMIVCILLLVACVSVGGELLIEYKHAGLLRVSVTERKQLDLAWTTGRCPFDELDASPMRQTIEAYDSHGATIWLTKSEMEQLRKWIVDGKIFELESAYPEPEQKTYGSAFHSSLSVELDGKKKSVAWTGDTKVPSTLHTAINALVKMCQDIRQSREGK
jgi:hypothetical protein